MGFKIYNGVLVKYEGGLGVPEVVIPEGVTSIGKSAFSWSLTPTRIVIPEGVTSIGEEAFELCLNLTSIVIPEGVTSIGKKSFGSCESLTNLVIPESVTSIGEEAFSGCSNLTSIVIPEGVTSIGKRAFSKCSALTRIVIPKSVTSIGEAAFIGCSNLASIVIPEGVTSIGDGAFIDCSNLTRIVIPEGVTSIGKSAFSRCSRLTSIVIPESVTSIGDGAFNDCSNLTSIIIPEGVNLFSLVIPDGSTKIGDKAFSGWKNLTRLVIPDGVTSIGDGAFNDCSNLTSIIIPEGVTSIGWAAFLGCSGLTSLIIPEGVTSIRGYAFKGCSNLTSIVIPESVTSIGIWAFSDCSALTRIVIPESVTSIGEGAFIGSEWGTFSGCSNLTSIVIPESVTSIGDQAFKGCSSLTNLVIPDGVTSIGQMVFEGCTELKEIHNILSLILKGCKIHVTTYTWLLENIWNGPEFLSEIVQVYFTNPGKVVNEICENRLFDNRDASADVMLGLIETYKSNVSALKKIASFALTCGGELPREKLIALYEVLQKTGAKPAMKLLEKAVQREVAPTLEGGIGHPIEAICLKRFNEAFVDKRLKDYKVPLNLFEGVHYKASKTLAPPFVLKCAIFPYMQQLIELPRNIGDYQRDFIQVSLDAQVDEIADTLDREELQRLMARLISKCDPLEQPRLLLPYCRYGSGKQMNDLAALGKKWTNWEKYLARGRRNNIVIRGAMLLNDNREAMFLVEKWGLLDEYARIRNTTADVIRDTVLTEFDLDADGSKRYDLGNAVIAASIMQDLSVTLFNETDKKEVKSLPKKGADPEKYAAASEDFADLKKNIKNAVKSRVEKLKEDFVSGRELKASDWKASYLNNYILKRVASLLVWQWKYEGSTTRFMLTMDGAFLGCDGQPVEVSDAGSIVVAHPVEIPTAELSCWKSLLTEKQLAQPFVQIFEPICDGDLSAAAARYRGIELPMFLLRGLAKEGIVVNFFDYEDYNKIWFNGQATEIVGNVVPAMYFSEKSIAFDAIVKLSDVTIKGKPRAVNHEIYAMDKALIENRVRNGDIAAVQAFSRGITAKTILHLIDVSIQAEKMEVTAWLMNYKNDHFPYTFADLEL